LHETRRRDRERTVIKDQTNFSSGALLIVMGAGCSILSLGYGLGTPGRIGSGLFPFCLGLIMAGLGLVLILQSCAPGAERDRLVRWDLKSLVLILASVLAFALLLPTGGLILAIVGLVIVSSLAHQGFRWRLVVPTALVLSALCYAIFVFALKLQLPVWPEFA
jgi:hypothetical protein